MEKLYYSRKDIAQITGMPIRKVIYVIEKHKIKPKCTVYANEGGKKYLYTRVALKRVKELLNL